MDLTFELEIFSFVHLGWGITPGIAVICGFILLLQLECIDLSIQLLYCMLNTHHALLILSVFYASPDAHCDSERWFH